MGTFDHIHIYAADVSETMAFYCDVLGADRVGDLPTSAGGVNHLVILGGQYVAISEFPPGMTPRAPSAALDGALDTGYGIAHFGFNVTDLEPALTRLADAGCAVHGPPRRSGPLLYAYVTGPDGVVIELTQYVLPAHLRPAVAALRAFDSSVHRVKRTLGRALIAAA